MARRSLRPQLNQIRTWVRQGRTDAWIAHQLEATVQQIATFKAENDLAEGGPEEAAATSNGAELDLRAEDDALIAAELEADALRRAEEQAKAAAEAEAQAKKDAEERAARGEDEGDEDEGDDAGSRRRRRGRRGGRGRRSSQTTFEGTFDHGEEGYGLWLDPAVADSALYAEHWAGHRRVEIVLEDEQIVIRRVETGASTSDSED